MKTEISDFCRDYSRALIPVGKALDEAIGQIERDSQEEVLRLNLAGLNEVKHRLKSLIDKVEGQQAYLLIFGPLKSGKSTLMNAISSAYVSEVTSLPAYPCLVYVRHGEPTIKLTRYNGRETETGDKHVMEVIIKDSHANLADRIRKAEKDKREFDPGLDYPEAIRRIDIDLKASDLNNSGTVLVDTPGLYSKMKFGYDLMTREFRDSASCAVFVVKTENLFFEQVFEEFNDLLRLFSRVFLVVNIDSSKRDLRPDGDLQPSEESRDPKKIINAFQLLSMSASLRSAWDEGRLKIYPVDLLKAASRRLKEAKEIKDVAKALAESVLDFAQSDLKKERSSSSSESESESESESSESENQDRKDQKGESQDRPDDFQNFLEDLTQYLNSSDYLFELMNDSFRQGDLLREEVSKSCEDGAIEEFSFQQRRLRSNHEEVDLQMKAGKELAEFDWEKAFESTYADVEREVSTFAREVKMELRRSLQRGIDEWFETSDCLGDLIKTWAEKMQALQRQIASKAAIAVKDVLDSSSGGARPKHEIIIALDKVHLALREVYQSSIGTLSDLPKVAQCQIELDVNDIPVHRSFWDRIFFQSQSKVRRRLLGTTAELKNEISPNKKRKRLLPAGKQALEKIVEDQLEALLPGIPNRCSRDYLRAYVECFKGDFSKLLKRQLAEFDKVRQQLDHQIEAGNRISRSFQSLDLSISRLEDEMARLKSKFLRSARLARGFRFVDTRTGAFSLWTLPYVAGISLVPLMDQNHKIGDASEDESEVESKDESEDKLKFEHDANGIHRGRAFTIWTEAFLNNSNDDDSINDESDDDEPNEDRETCNVDETENSEDETSPIRVSLPISENSENETSSER